MIPEQTLLSYPVFGDNATKVEPDNNKKSNGWQQGDVVPAEWMNWGWYHNSKGITDLNKGVSSMEKELNNVLSSFGITPAELTNNQLLTAMRLNNSFVSASSTTITGPLLVSGGTIRVLFTQNITGSDTTTGLTISYNTQSIAVKVYKDGSLENFTAAKISWQESSVVHRYIDAGTTVELLYDGTQFIIVNDPVVLKSSKYAIHADGSVEGGAIGDVKPIALVSIPYGWLECDGSAKSRTEFAKLFNFFSNEKYDSSHTLLSRYGTGNGSTTFNLPDYREVTLVGAGQNGTEGSALNTHDVYTVGEFKDDQIQQHEHVFKAATKSAPYAGASGDIGFFWTYYDEVTKGMSGRQGYTTRGKRKGVKYIIKVL